MSEYELASRGSLKLKKVSDHKIKKKKSKKPKGVNEKEMAEMMNSSNVNVSSRPVEKKTAAEIAFEKAKEKRVLEEIMKKASKTHKERIMEFNQKLDSLTEHFDIPKVSWTK